MKIQLWMYKGKGTLEDRLIRWWTNSIYSHCELVIDGICYSSSTRDKGVRSKVIDFDSSKWDAIDIDSKYAAGIFEYFEKTKGSKYAYIDLIFSQILNRVYNTEGAEFCSEWCASALGLPNPTLYSPQTLKDLIVYLKNFGIF